MIIRPSRLKQLNKYAMAGLIQAVTPLLNSDLLSITGIALTAGLIFKAEYNRVKDKYVIKDNEVTHERGIFKKSRTTSPVDRISQMKVTQSLFQKMFRYGDLELETWGQPLKLSNVHKPQVIADRIKELQKDCEL
ncbi:MAG: PH domain-containing protein [Candidatus Nanoarchaeia archaeon]|jgi:uncharacterized membrane protein YdbT with pleckstrin-like domain